MNFLEHKYKDLDAKKLFNLNAIPSDTKLIHSQMTFDSYRIGLGCNTMEGREQKHQVIAKY